MNRGVSTGGGRRDTKAFLYITLLLAWVVSNGLGCATPIGVDQMDPREVRSELTASVLSNGELSQATDLVLQRLGLAERFEDEPKEVITLIREHLVEAPDRADRTFALAELCFHYALESGDTSYYLGSAILAYAYLFPENLQDLSGPLDPRRRVAADIYNQGLAEGLRTGEDGALELTPRTLSFPFGDVNLIVDEEDLDWHPYRLTEFLPTVEYGVRGMRNRYRTPGIGAALIAGLEPMEGVEVPRGHRVPPNLRVPVTVLLHPGDVFAGIEAGEINGELHLYIQDRSDEIEINGFTLPLEYDITTPLAYSLETSAFWDFELAGFRLGSLNPLEKAAPDGLFLMAPYHPGRVPVVLVHGTASSPARWAELVNEIMGDPTLNHRVQPWFFTYPTGNPILLSGANLRESLATTVAELDPDGVDAALENMVVIGHSQGGLLTKLQVVDSGNSFWENVSDKPVEETQLSEETRAMLERVTLFAPLPFVKRVIFMATPHGGSYLASFRLSNLASGLVTLPVDVAKMGVELVDTNEDREAERRLKKMPTAVDNMRPGDAFLVKLREKPLAPGVEGHSIIGTPKPGPPEGQDDGVVRVEDARLVGVESEYYVRSKHSLQGHPDSINEVKRILRKHLAELGL